MKFSGVFSAAALLFAGVQATPLDSFAEGGNLPSYQIGYGSEGGHQAYLKKREGAIVPRQASDSSCVNSPTSRNCWSPGFSVDTDFDQKWPSTGVTRYYTLTITNTTCNPDGGSPGRRCMLINNQFPGPLIRANWGDNVYVTVNNNMKSNGTSIHWHGLRQLSSTSMDGVNGITECALAPGNSKVYKLQATQFGTSWYHSHHAAQYGEGIVGPIIIDGPTSDNWDIDLGPLAMQDWFYMSAQDADIAILDGLNSRPPGPGPSANNILLNGTNMNPAGTSGKYLNFKVQKGKKHLLRLINMSVDNTIRVSIDNHPLEIITADFVPVKPIFMDSVLVNVGQRYEVIINANQSAGNYWLRAEAESTGCFSFNEGTGYAIMTYQGQKVATPATKSSYTNGGNCNEPAPLTPWVPNIVGNSTNFLAQVATLPIGLGGPGGQQGVSGIPGNPYIFTEGNVVVWGINATSMDVNWGKPVLQYVMDNNNTFPRTENLIELAYEGEWTYWIIQNLIFAGAPPPPHPIHLHGHDFYVLGSGVGAWDNSFAEGLLFNNPVRRDTATLPGNGWLAIAFPTDNPGAWLMHCHIAWHISEGLGLQFLEAASSIQNLPQAGDAWSQQCVSWNNYWKNTPWPKFGSGL